MSESNGTHTLDKAVVESAKRERDWARAKAVEFTENDAYDLAKPYAAYAERLTLILREYGVE